MSISVTKTYYDTKSGYGISKRRLSSITNLIGDLKDKDVLDIGCGNGFLGNHFKSLGAKSADGCDISKEAVKKATEVLDFVVECDLEVDDFSEKFLGKKYDVIVATELIEHLFKPDIFVEKIKPLLKENGVLILTTPNFLVWTNRLRMLFGQFEYTKTGFLDEGHIHFFTYTSLKKMLKENGYQVVDENNIYHPKIPSFIARYIPKLSVFQMVFKCVKS